MSRLPRPRRPRFGPIVAGATIVAVSLAGAACNGDGGDGRQAAGRDGDQPLRLVIGNSLPLSGALAEFGRPGRKAGELAGAEIEAAIRKAGIDHRVEVVHADNRTDARAAARVARQLAREDGASCIAGAWAPADTIATAQSVAARDRVALISPASTSDEITVLADDGLVFRTAPPDSFQGSTLAGAIAADLGGAKHRTVNVGARDDAYGAALAEAFARAWERRGGRIGERVVYGLDQRSYDAEAERLVSGKPDATVIFDLPRPFVRLAAALVETRGWKPATTWASDGLATSEIAKELGAKRVEGLRGTAPGTPDERAAAAFDRLYRSSSPREVGRQTFDAQTFDAVILCYLAAVAAGSATGEELATFVSRVSAPPGRRYTWERLPAAIEALAAGEEIDLQGASGELDLDPDGDPTSGVYELYEFRRGEPRIADEIPITPPP